MPPGLVERELPLLRLNSLGADVSGRLVGVNTAKEIYVGEREDKRAELVPTRRSASARIHESRRNAPHPEVCELEHK
jgi:hypothetical protein